MHKQLYPSTFRIRTRRQWFRMSFAYGSFKGGYWNIYCIYIYSIKVIPVADCNLKSQADTSHTESMSCRLSISDGAPIF